MLQLIIILIIFVLFNNRLCWACQKTVIHYLDLEPIVLLSTTPLLNVVRQSSCVKVPHRFGAWMFVCGEENNWRWVTERTLRQDDARAWHHLSHVGLILGRSPMSDLWQCYKVITDLSLWCSGVSAVQPCVTQQSLYHWLIARGAQGGTELMSTNLWACQLLKSTN